jgi:hypothetical protein
VIENRSVKDVSPRSIVNMLFNVLLVRVGIRFWSAQARHVIGVGFFVNGSGVAFG